MENTSTYKGLDLRKVTMYDIAELYEDKPALLISPDDDLSDDQERILAIYTYAENYSLTDLKEKMEILYKKELFSILS